jgi:hypothetical protein
MQRGLQHVRTKQGEMKPFHIRPLFEKYIQAMYLYVGKAGQYDPYHSKKKRKRKGNVRNEINKQKQKARSFFH